jgi:hypothetical protein
MDHENHAGKCRNRQITRRGHTKDSLIFEEPKSYVCAIKWNEYKHAANKAIDQIIKDSNKIIHAIYQI